MEVGEAVMEGYANSLTSSVAETMRTVMSDRREKKLQKMPTHLFGEKNAAMTLGDSAGAGVSAADPDL